ncbi:hypothetical protein Tco_0408530 [Tanacetum coccineum]
MASHRLNPLYAIKECMTCGSLYTRECCSIGSLGNKILVPEPESSPCCAKCGTPVDGPYCRGCALLRKNFKEDLLTYCGENETSKDFEDISESSDDNTNVVNAPREPFVVNQDPGEKSSQGPPLINQNCCYECGDSLDGIFCQQCICKFCGKGAHYGYNCPPKVPIISNPEQCNQTINELPQILPNVHPTCNYEDENSFIYDSKPHSFNITPSVFNQPPQPQFETYLCELCGNNAHYGYDCSPQFPFVYEQEPCYNQNFNDNYFPQNSQSYSQQYLCCANCGGPHETFQCQPMNEDYCEQNSCYYPNSSSFDHSQPPQDSIDYQGILQQAYEDEKYSAACRYMLSITCDDEDDYIPSGDIIARYSTSKSITPDLPDNSLNMGDEHLDTIPATESNEVIKSSVENLVPIPCEFEGISNDSCDMPICDIGRINVESDFVESLINLDTSIDNSSKIDPIFEEFAGELAHIAPIPPVICEADFDSNDDTSSDDDDFEDVEYVSFEEVNDVNQEEKEFDLDDILQIQDVILREKLLNVSRLISNIESLKYNPIPVLDSDSSVTSFSFSNNSLPEFESFSDHSEETRSGSTTTHANYSLPEYESFHFDNPSFSHPPPKPPDVEILEPEINNFDVLNNDESFDPREGENVVFLNDEEDDSFTFTVRTFLPFVTYPEASPLSCSTGSADTIFDPGIST